MLSTIYEWLIAKVANAQDAKYWSNVFGMTGVACFAVAFLDFRLWAFFVGLFLCLVGLRMDRKGRMKNDSE